VQMIAERKRLETS